MAVSVGVMSSLGLHPHPVSLDNHLIRLLWGRGLGGFLLRHCNLLPGHGSVVSQLHFCFWGMGGEGGGDAALE